MLLQSAIKSLFPPQCVLCDTRTEVDFALCGSCWAETPFIDGAVCGGCGVPLPHGGADDDDLTCDDCLRSNRPWSMGRAAMVYNDRARRVVLSLKYGDRLDLARAAGPWLARAARPLLTQETVVVPVPLHRLRLIRRKFNQAAVLAKHMCAVTGHDMVPDALIRPRKTAPLEGHDVTQRFAELNSALIPHPTQGARLAGRPALIVDDVMTSGATFTAATEACFAAGARDVRVLALARTTKNT